MIHSQQLRQTLRVCLLFLFLAFGATSLTSAAGNPGFLDASTSNVPGGTKTYRVWYTVDCNGGADCECDNNVSGNDCVASTDSDTDGVMDTGPDDDGDGVLDVVDTDFTGSGTGTVESVPYNIQRTLDRYVNDWSLEEPKWDTDTNRDVFVYDLGYYGVAYSDGSGIELDTAWMLTQAPEPRGTVLHELWHMTQYKYGARSSKDGKWYMDGQARMLQDKVFDDLDNLVSSRYHDSVNAYMGNTTYVNWEDRDDDGVGEFAQADGLLGASYNASPWWTYLADQAGTQYAGTAGDGMDALEGVLEQSDDHDRHGVDAVDQELRDRIGQGFDDTFWDFTVANYAKDFDLSRLDHDYLDGRDPETVLKYSDEKRTAPDEMIYGDQFNDPLRGWVRGVERETFDVADLMAIQAGSVDAMDSEVSDPDAMSAYGANYYEGILDNSENCLLAYWRVIGEDGARFMHSFMMVEEDTNSDGDEEVVTLLRSEGKDFARAAWNYGKRAAGGAYTRIVGIVATGDDPYGYDWEMGCTTPEIDIIDPTTDDPAYVGDPDDPGRFLIWLEVTGGAATTYVAGLEWSRDFTITVGGDTAEILNGGYVQNQYWLAVRAPEKPGATVGDKFDLTAQLGSGAGLATDTETDAVIYDLVVSDQVLVIDRSGSMADFSKLDSAKTAARLFAEVAQKFDMLGVVSFSDDATEEYPLTTIPDQDDAAGKRADAQTAIDGISDETTTSIGDGLQKGQDMLDASGNAGHDWWMVLLSDGMENESQYWSDVKSNITSAGTKVHAIALGQDADEDLMQEIAEETCGSVWQDYCYDFIEESGVLAATGLNAPVAPRPVYGGAEPTAVTATPLHNSLADIYRGAKETIAGHQRLWQDSGTLSTNQTLYVNLNEDSVKEAVFSFNWNDSSAPLDVDISPTTVNFIELTDGQNHTVFYTDTLPSGTYTLTLTALSGASEWIGSLAGRLIHGTEMHAFIDNTQTQRYPGLPVRLQVSLTDDQGGVAGAAIRADVRRPDGSYEQIQVVDDGGPYDDIANDGVYGYVYDRINRPLAMDVLRGHSWVFNIHAQGVNNSGQSFDRYKRLSYTPYLGREQVTLDNEPDGMLDRWENRFKNVDSTVPDGGLDLDNDGLTNKREFELGTNPDDPDTDRGGETDGSEVAKGQNPLLTADDTIPPVTGFWIENLPESVGLYFNPRPEYQTMRVYRRSGWAGPFAPVGDFDPSSGEILDKPLVNDQDYFYFMQPLGTSGVEGRPTRILYAEPAADPYQPEGIVVINDDDLFTPSKNVILTFQGLHLPDGSLDVRHVQISNSADLTGAPWVTFSPTRTWTIDPEPGTGLAFVYVRYRDGAGNVSDAIYGDGIIYKPPAVLPAGLLTIGRLILDFTDAYFGGWTIIHTPLNRPSLPLNGSAMSTLSTQGLGSCPLGFAGLDFDLQAQDAQGQPRTQFDKPFRLEIHYEDWQWRSGGIGYEQSLNLLWNTGQEWKPVLPCDGCSLDMRNNVIVAVLDHLTEFALVGNRPLPEDVDLDGDVDVFDIADASQAWRATIGDPNYSLARDVNKDSVVDIIDVQRIAANWGWELTNCN